MSYTKNGMVFDNAKAAREYFRKRSGPQSIRVMNLDPELLREQRDALLSTIQNEKMAQRDMNREDSESTGWAIEKLDGLVNLLDSMIDDLDGVSHPKAGDVT